MSAFATLENRLADAWQDIKTDARADLEQALADVKAELEQAKTDAEQLKAQAGQDAEQLKTTVLGQVQPLLAQFGAAVKVAVEQAEPGIQTTVAGLVEKLIADAAKIGVTSL